MGGRVPDDWENDADVDDLRDRWGLSEYDYGEELRVEDEPLPTHRCGVCRDYDDHIESAPGKTYHWCPECERVTKFIRLDRHCSD
jgi:hypothetical protein